MDDIPAGAGAADFPDDDSPEAQIARLRTDAERLPVDRSLLPMAEAVPDDAAISAPVPEIRATTEERFNDFVIDGITHVVISVTLPRQIDILAYVGYQYDWNRPGPCWYFLGKLVAKGIWDGQTELQELNYVAVRRRDFIAYTTSKWKAAVEAEKAAGRAGRSPLSVIEVNFKKPQPGQPLEMTWAPARAVIASQVGQMKHFSDRSDAADLPKGNKAHAQ
ncbi:hypothetical protein C8A01DRAFT_36986 [Parachaetomium inaequale]|uniref:Uncharacterized protein n=1 Tax=Parachaetomium inaequale TaxID=2588326 RepID=A0AAN6PDP4_9PEZI|nr:hypothetical protein C8A01DRAFT_36986 [Parachaetomium inaequale]